MRGRPSPLDAAVLRARALFSVVVLLLMAVGGCAGDPANTLQRFLEAEHRGRLDVAWRHLHPDDRRARPLAAWKAEHAAAGPVWELTAVRTSFEQVGAELEPSRARIDVVATHPDLAALQDAIPPAAFQGTERDLRAAAHRALESGIAPTTSRTRYVLRRAPRAWKVWLGLREQDAAQAAWVAYLNARRDADLEAEARTLEQLLALEPDPSGVVQMLQQQAQRLAAQDM